MIKDEIFCMLYACVSYDIALMSLEMTQWVKFEDPWDQPSEFLEWFWLLFVLFTNCLNFQYSTNINQHQPTIQNRYWFRLGQFWLILVILNEHKKTQRHPNRICWSLGPHLRTRRAWWGGGLGRDLQGKWQLGEIELCSIIFCFIFQTYHIRFYVLMTCFILFHHILLCFAGWLTQFYQIFWRTSRDKKQWWACLQNWEPPDLWWGPLLYVQSIKWELRGPDYYVLAHPCPVSASNIQKSDGWRCKRDYFDKLQDISRSKVGCRRPHFRVLLTWSMPLPATCEATCFNDGSREPRHKCGATSARKSWDLGKSPNQMEVLMGESSISMVMTNSLPWRKTEISPHKFLAPSIFFWGGRFSWNMLKCKMILHVYPWFWLTALKYAELWFYWHPLISSTAFCYGFTMIFYHPSCDFIQWLNHLSQKKKMISYKKKDG